MLRIIWRYRSTDVLPPRLRDRTHAGFSHHSWADLWIDFQDIPADRPAWIPFIYRPDYRGSLVLAGSQIQEGSTLTKAQHPGLDNPKITLRVDQVPPGLEMPVRMAARQLAKQLGKDVLLFINGKEVLILADFQKH